MSDIIGNPHLKLDVDRQDFEKGLSASEAAVGASLSRSEKLANAGTKRIQRQIDALNATKPRQQMFELSQAVMKMGGVSALTGDQVERLKRQVEGLAAAGAKMPKVFAGLGSAGGAGGAAGAAAQNLAGGLAPGGALGAGLAALGPAGIAVGAGIGSIAVAAKTATETVGALVERAGKLTDLAEKTGLSTDALQKLDYVGSQVGVSLDASAGAVLKLQRTLGEAVQGSAKARQAFADIGLSWEELRSLTPEEQFAKVSQALGTIPDRERMVAAGADLMGRGFAEIIPLVQHAQEVMSAPVALDATVIQQADDLGDAFTRLGAAAEGLKLQLGVAFLRGFSGGADASKAIDTITAAVTGLGKVLSSETFVNAIKIFDTFTLGIGRTVKGLAEIGKAEADMAKVTAFAKEFGERRAAAAKADAAQEAARQREEAKAAAAARAQAAAVAAKAAAEERKEVDALSRSMGAFFDDLAKRRSARETFDLLGESIDDVNFKMGRLADQVERFAARDGLGGLSNSAIGKAIGDLQKLQAQGGTNAYGLQQLGVLQGEQARRAATASTAGEIKDLGLQVLTVNDKLAHLGTTMLSNRNEVTKTKKETIDWTQQLANAAHIIEGMPISLGKVGAATASIATGIAGIGAAKESWDKAKDVKGLGGLLGKVSSGLGIASAAIGIGASIISLFKKDPVEQAAKKAGKALGTTISKELAQQFLEESKRTGQSIAQVAKKWQAEQDKAAAEAKRKSVEEGIDAARGGLEALLGDVARLQSTPELQAAIAGIEAKVAEAVAKSGLGFLATGALKTSEAFGAAQGAAKSGGQVLAGMRQAGMVDQGLTAAMSGLATELQRQAIDAAKAAGLSDAEAQKAGSGAIADLLREQLNASLASGQELDANTKALIEEARQNGIEIIADPMLQQLKTQQQSLAELEQIRGLMASGGAAFDKYGSFVSGRTFSAQAGLPPAIMPNMGGGVGPLIQTHPGELALVIPRTQVGGSRRSLARSGALPVGDEAYTPRATPEELARAQQASGPLTVNAEFPVKFDHTVSFETVQQFSRAVAKEARRLFDQADPDVMRSVRRRLGLAT